MAQPQGFHDVWDVGPNSLKKQGWTAPRPECYLRPGVTLDTGKLGLDLFATEEDVWDAHCSDTCAEEQFKLGNHYSSLARANPAVESEGARRAWRGVTLVETKFPDAPSHAAKWYRLAADQGHPGAQTELAGLYMQGLGVRADKARGVKWFQKASKQGHADAQYRLGDCCLNGTGIGVNEKEAVRLFQLASRNRVLQADRALGDCYSFGLGVAKSESKAKELYTKVARAEAVAVGDIIFEGQSPGDVQADTMGVFELLEPLQLVMGRAVWRSILISVGLERDYCYFTGSVGKWIIGNEANMLLGKAAGCLISGGGPMSAGDSRERVSKSEGRPERDALTPDQVNDGWRVFAPARQM